MTKIYNLFAKYNFLEKFLILWAIFAGSLSLVLFFLGLVSLFYRSIVIVVVIVFFLLFFLFLKKIKFWADFKAFWHIFKKAIRQDRWLLAIIIVFLLFVLMNFVVALAPETGFDALWYHLTLPKIYLAVHQIRFISGNNLYYSVMSRTVEMLYGAALAFNPTGILAKLTHLFFGLTWFSGTYLFCRLFLSRRVALFSSLIIYGTTLVSWLSQTAYIDLAVTFFVVMSLWQIFRYFKSQDNFNLYLSAIFMGFALASKTYELIIFAIIALIILGKNGLKPALKFSCIALIIVFPYFLQAYLATGHIIYPTTSFIDSTINYRNWYLFTWWHLLPKSLYQTFVFTYTPILAMVPFIFLARNWQKMILPIIILGGYIVLYSIVPFHDPRYFLVILPVIALLIGYIIANFEFRLGQILLIVFAVIIMFYNFNASLNGFGGNIKVVLGLESRNQYLCTYAAPAFYDCNGFLDTYTKPNDKIWVGALGSRFYLNRPFADYDYDPAWRNFLTSATKFHQYLQNNNFRYVLLGGGKTLAQFSNINESDLNPYFKLVHSDSFYNLYKIK